ncbi:MAG: polysaccharide biosynthesis/export family protein [Verrucomicrobiales bacterium]
MKRTIQSIACALAAAVIPVFAAAQDGVDLSNLESLDPEIIVPKDINPGAKKRADAAASAAAANAARPVAPAAVPAGPQVSEAGAMVKGTTKMDVLENTRPLNYGDLISYKVVEDGDEPIRLRITDSGEVEIPLIGRVPAVGRTCFQLAYAIKAELEKEYYNKATVIVGIDTLARSNNPNDPNGIPGMQQDTITIMGYVRRQGQMSFPPDGRLTASQAILNAGGFAPFAKETKVKIVRTVGDKLQGEDGHKTKTIYVNLKDVMRKGRLDKDVLLQPHDVIIVEDKLFNF